MSTDIGVPVDEGSSPPPAAPPAPPRHSEPSSDPDRAVPAKILIGLAGLVLVVWAVGNLFLAFGYHPEWFADSKVLIGVLALVAGVGGAWTLFFFINMFVEGLPGPMSRGLMPYAFVFPGFGLIALMLLYPTIQTINYSFANDDSTKYVGFDNYRFIFQWDEFWTSIGNNVLWLVLVPATIVVVGTIVAVLSDKLSPTGEKVSKSFIFMPMAISFVGASAIWTLVYQLDTGDVQTGLLNAVFKVFGGDPQAWLQLTSLKLNSMLMMVILVWLQVGFAMVLLSSAIKGVPEETIEAARIDGATEFQIFRRVVIPQIKGTIITVFITAVILVLKVFDIVYVMTNGRDKTDVIANLFFKELFANSRAGRASAIVVILLLAVTPVLVYQVRHFRKEELGR